MSEADAWTLTLTVTYIQIPLGPNEDTKVRNTASNSHIHADALGTLFGHCATQIPICRFIHIEQNANLNPP